jgi:DNA-binding SARP family transcriptional activator
LSLDNRRVGAPVELTEAELAAITDPAELLHHSWELEPWGRYAEREAVLDRLEALLVAGGAPAAPAGREWRLELMAERAVDVGRSRALEQALALTQQVLAEADASHEIALGRAMLARGQAWAWYGTDEATRESNRAFAEAAERFAALGNREWQGSALLRRGYSACYQYGDILLAEELISQALDAYLPGSDRLAGALAPYADVLLELGEFDRAEDALDRAEAFAQRDHHDKALTDITYARAALAAARRDAGATERLLLEAERGASQQDWFTTHIGTSFLLEAAEMLDRVGALDQARRYFERARERAGDRDDEVTQTRAVMGARSGDPEQALADLQRIARGDWLEKRVVWRHTLLIAWATFRASREGAGELASRALQQAQSCGTTRIAVAGEPEIVAALAPFAERAGSALARELLLEHADVIVRVFGRPTVTHPNGKPLELPPGMPGELIRMLALHEHGLPVDVVLETLFRDAPVDAARQRLRQVLSRARSAVGEIIVRDDDRLRLVPAWVDVREFLAASRRARQARDQSAVMLAYVALALHGGSLLPDDTYAEWAQETRGEVTERHLALLDLVAADATSRGSHREAITALEAAAAEDPDERSRHAAIAEHLRALGSNQAAEHIARRTGQNLGANLGTRD